MKIYFRTSTLLFLLALWTFLSSTTGMPFQRLHAQEGPIKEARLILPKQDNDGNPFDPNIKSELELKLLENFGGFTTLEGVGGWESGSNKNDTVTLVVHHEPVWIYDVACTDDLQSASELTEIANWIKIVTNQLSVYVRFPNGNVVFV